MRSAAYWRQRMEAVQNTALRPAERALRDLEIPFDAAKRELESEIAKWYARFADNNAISLADAKRLLSGRELEEFRWNVQEYMRYAEENAGDGRWTKQLENASARVHISRLDALKLQMQQYAEQLYGNQLDMLDNVLRTVYTEGYYHSMHVLQVGLGVSFLVDSFDENMLDKLLSRPWTTDGRTFRDRCWTNKQLLTDTLQKQLVRSCITGAPSQKLIDDVKRAMDVSRYKAGRLVMTESAYFSAQAQKNCFDELGVEQYEIIGTLDMSTCASCGELDKKVFRQADYEPGVTAPPFHPNCRCTTAPYFDDWEELDFKATRAARDGDGRTYDVPREMTYKEWHEKFVLNKSPWNDIIGMETADGHTVEAIKNHFLEQAQFRTVSSHETMNALAHPLHVTPVKYNTRGEASVQYIGREATVVYNPEKSQVVTAWRTGTDRRKKYGGKQ